LAFDNGNNYQIQLTNEGTGESVTFALADSVTASADTHISLSLYRADGTPKDNPQVWVVGDGFYAIDIVDGAIPEASGPTDFSVSLQDSTDGSELARTETRQSVVGYTGIAAQNSTSGQIRVSLPRDTIPESASAELGVWQEGQRDNTTFVPMSYDSDAEEFVAVLDASSFASGNYSWDIGLSVDEWQILQVRSPNSANEWLHINVDGDTADDSNTDDTGDDSTSSDGLSLSQQSGTTTSDSTNTTRSVSIASDTELTVDTGNNYQFRLTDEGTGESVTFTIADSVTVPADTHISLSLYQPDGTPKDNPQVWVVGDGFYAIDIVDGTIPAVAGPTDFSVALLDASDGSELTRTETRQSVVGYTGVAAQNSTSGQIRVSLPQNTLPAEATAELGVWQEGQRDDTTLVPMSYDSDTEEFVAVLDASSFASGNYSWDIGLSVDDWQILQVRSPNSANEWLNIGVDGDSSSPPTETVTQTETATQTERGTQTDTATQTETVTQTETATQTETTVQTEATQTDSETAEPTAETAKVTGNTTATSPATTAADGPGFGIGVALLAILVAAMGIGRRT
jgi:PGF-CTERM protein